MHGGNHSLEDGIISDIEADSPGHRPGTRPIHAPGIAVAGWFQATDIARNYSVAEHFDGERVRVTARFSNGTGALDVPDADPTLVRGMAVKFHLSDRGEGRTDADMIAMTLPVFFVRTAEEFREFTVAVRPAPVKRQPRWRKLADMLAVRLGPPEPPKGAKTSNAPGFYDYARRNRFAAPSYVAYGMLTPPESYSTCSYNAVHAFVLTGPDGMRRSVRFRWEPVDGVRAAPRGTVGDYLFAELERSLALSGIEFVLRMQVGEEGDDPTDPTQPWSQRRPRIVMGHLLLEAIAPDQRENAELISFNPTHLVPGIEVSGDKTLQLRGSVYERSAALRRAETGAGG